MEKVEIVSVGLVNHKVSIIIPVYNVEKYLKRCVQSVINQSYENWELILVNDGSSDSSENICKQYSESDARISLINKKNSGSSDSRNMALELATGDFVMFVDSDDYLHFKILDTLIKMFKNDQVDIATCGFRSVDETTLDSLELEEIENEEPHAVLRDTDRALVEMMYQRSITNSPWAKLYRRTTIGDIRYPSGEINQDLGTTYKIISNARTVATTSLGMYFYTYRPGSVINSSFSAKRMAGLRFAHEQHDYIDSRHPLAKKASTNRLFMESVFIIMAMNESDVKKFNQYHMQCVRVIKQTRGAVLKDRNSKMRYRVFSLITYLFGPSSLRLIGDIYRLKKNGVVKLIARK